MTAIRSGTLTALFLCDVAEAARLAVLILLFELVFIRDLLK